MANRGIQHQRRTIVQEEIVAVEVEHLVFLDLNYGGEHSNPEGKASLTWLSIAKRGGGYEKYARRSEDGKWQHLEPWDTSTMR